MFGMADDEESVENALMASSSTTNTSSDSVNSNLVTIMVDSRASGLYFDDAIICHLKYHLHDHYVHLATLHKTPTAGEALLDEVRRKACCKALSPVITTSKASFGSSLWWCPGLGATCSR